MIYFISNYRYRYRYRYYYYYYYYYYLIFIYLFFKYIYWFQDILKNVPEEFVEELILLMEKRVHEKGDIICLQGKPANELYILDDGVAIEIIKGQNKESKIIRGNNNNIM